MKLKQYHGVTDVIIVCVISCGVEQAPVEDARVELDGVLRGQEDDHLAVLRRVLQRDTHMYQH